MDINNKSKMLISNKGPYHNLYFHQEQSPGGSISISTGFQTLCGETQGKQSAISLRSS